MNIKMFPPWNLYTMQEKAGMNDSENSLSSNKMLFTPNVYSYLFIFN